MPRPELSRRDRQILRIVEELGEPHALEVLELYHERHGVPLEAVTVARILQRLVGEGELKTRLAPAPPEARFPTLTRFRLAQTTHGEARDSRGAQAPAETSSSEESHPRARPDGKRVQSG